jgi:MIT (microtubule interacting and transport) domain
LDNDVNLLCFAEYVKEAVDEDNAGNYPKAFELYKIALDYFSTHLKYEKNPRAKEAITQKVGLHRNGTMGISPHRSVLSLLRTRTDGNLWACCASSRSIWSGLST